MNQQFPHMAWVRGYSRKAEGRMPNTYTLDYSLKDLMLKNLINRAEGEHFLNGAGVSDFFWQLTFPEDFDMPDELLVNRIGDVQGYVVFVHGWTGNYNIWEDLPAMVCSTNRQLVSIAIDHNGFGHSIFTDTTPSLDSCNPPAAMNTLQKWVDLLKIRRQSGETKLKVVNFVGHSMGGAALFYLNPMLWRYGELTRFALAPALLLEDESHRLFYSTLGLGIGILHKLPILEIVERFIKPSMINTLVAGASDAVKKIHNDQYAQTPRGITGATFMAMGRLKNFEIARDFRLMRVMLGHRDPLVGLVDMMDLLCKLEFPAAHLHVVPGTHYMFSVGHDSPINAYQHAQNREMVVQDILNIHAEALLMQKHGYKIG